MTLISGKKALADLVLSFRSPDDVIQFQVEQVQQEILTRSQHVRDVNFTAIHPRDLELLFCCYDGRFLGAFARAFWMTEGSDFGCRQE
jgi:hypothetical protein